MKFKITTILFVFITALAIIFKLDLYIIILILMIYISVVIYGSSVICSDFYLKSFCKKQTNEKIFAISFDDGPNPEFTPKILEVLDKENICATFFCIGENIEKYPELAEQISKKHTLANHSYSHSNFFDIFPVSRVIEEIEQTNLLIKKITGNKNKYFRPPFGVTNPNIAKALRKLNMQSIGWSIRTLDTTNKTEKNIFNDFTKKINGGDIILLHDNSNKSVNLLIKFIDFAKENNFKIVELEKLIK
jgi:peptidoglycan/xylan/chitin deacetylase (PgdA/CDA1 family)